MLTPDQLNNLPEETKKEYLKTVLLLEEKKKQEAIRQDFLSFVKHMWPCLLYTSPSPRDVEESRMPSSA